MPPDFRQIVHTAAARPPVRQAVRQIYEQTQRQIDARRPVCIVSGRCCRFEEFGHRLFVTTLELAAFVADFSPPSSAAALAQTMKKWDGTGCPFQVGKLCGVHAIRPFGCRIYFCDAGSTAWQNEQYERFLADLKQAHDRLEVPYYYVEWRAALEAVGLAPTGA